MEAKNAWYDLPPEVWAEIFVKLNSVNEYDEIIYDTQTIYSVMFVCEYFANIMQINYIWEKMCEAFLDFDRLEFMHEHQGLSWREVYKNRLTGILKTKEIRVGDQQNPENCILFQIHGNGHVYVSTDWTNTSKDEASRSSGIYSPTLPRKGRRMSLTKFVRRGSSQYIMVPITEVSSAIGQLYEREQEEKSILDRVTGILPFTRAGKIRRENVFTLRKIQGGLFVDISAYSPFVLLLSKMGDVYEFMFLPHGVQNYEGMYVPKAVHFEGMQEGEKVVYVKATQVANFAVTNHQRIFAWAMYDDPVQMCKRVAPPVEIEPLRGKMVKKIKCLSREHTAFHLRDTEEPLVVENDQLFYLIVAELLC
jgi:hypothetical protein